MKPRNFERPSQYRDPELDFSGEVIAFYGREFYALDNFSSFQVEWDGYLFPTSEHAYHYEKFKTTAPEIAELIKAARSAHDAFKTAHEHEESVRPDWEDVKVEIMEAICAAKLSQHEYVQRKLLQTGNLAIVEDSPKDAFWGWGPNRNGRNELGKVWMRLRDALLSSV